MRGVEGMGGLRFWDAKPRRSAEAGQDSFPGQRRRSRRASTEWLDGDAGEWRGAGCQRVVCDRPCADLVLKRPCVSLAWVVAVAFLNVTSPNGCPDRESVSCKGGL
jgi:hypothetical protein